MSKLVAVGGTWGWDATYKQRSKIFDILCNGLTETNQFHVECFNGGSFQELEFIYRTQLIDADFVVWMANIDNTFSKSLVQNIKKDYPRIISVSSKRNIGLNYSIQDIIAHGLNLKSNLIIEIRGDDVFTGRLLDPLGNVWQNHTIDFKHIGNVIAKRVVELKGITRQNTIYSPEEPELFNEIPYGTGLVTFFDQVKRKAEIFHNLINPSVGITRFLGNASFRCELGFPSIKVSGGIYVSKRNVDKRHIGPESMVLTGWNKDKDIIWYRGDNKPSVDTPIQVKLYDLMPSWVNYMLHSHVYIKNAPFTEKMIPCGGLEEIDEIMKVVNNMKEPNCTCYTINLKGHGSLICAFRPSYFYQEFIPRPIPEII